MKLLHIEYLGVPAAGKSTIARAFLADARTSTRAITGNSSLHCNTGYARGVQKATICLSSMIHVAQSYRLWRSTSALNGIERWRLYSVLLAHSYHQRHAVHRLYDQGIYNYLITAVARNTMSLQTAVTLREKYAALDLLPRTIVNITISQSEAEQRLFSREQPHVLTHVSEEERSQFYTNYLTAAEALLLDTATVLEVDGTDDIEQTVATLQRTLPVAA